MTDQNRFAPIGWNRLALIGVVLGTGYWLIETAMDSFVFGLGTYGERLFTDDLNELEMRTLALVLLYTLGFYAQFMVNKLRKAEDRLTKMNECFLSFGADPVANIDRLTHLCGTLLEATAAFYNRLDKGGLRAWGEWRTSEDSTCTEKPDEQLCYEVIRRGSDEPVLIRNLQESDFSRSDPAVLARGLKTYLGHAIRLGDETVGSLCVVYQRDCVPSEEDRKFVGIIASAIGVEEVRRQARNALRESEARLRHLSVELISAQEIERKRIARQLHDSIGQSLSAIKYGIEDTMERMEAKGMEQKDLEALGATVPLIQQVVDEVRRIQKNLRPSVLDDLGILATITWFCREFQAIYSGIRIEKEIGIRENEVPETLKTVIYRIMQETMNNVAKHSGADHVQLFFGKTEDGLELGIRDNGRGFDLKAVASVSAREGIGLSSMRERAEFTGGSLEISSEVGAGTLVRAFWRWDAVRSVE